MAADPSTLVKTRAPSPSHSFKQKLGCWLHERWLTELVLRFPGLAGLLGLSWLNLCNRAEKLSDDVISGGRVCHWPDSSMLTVARIFPPVGSRLLSHALAAWPVRFNFTPQRVVSEHPKVSILIPIGGNDRLPQFELALAAARAQEGIEFEVVVIEQAVKPQLAARLPADVRYLHQRRTPGEFGFNKSWALNGGAREARGDALIILDGDYLLPVSFASEAFRVMREAEGARPARMLFYLDERSTGELSSVPNLSGMVGVEAVVANNPTPIVVRRSTYWEIGGHDEAYFGWGGEDTEFIDRLRTRSISEGGWLPVAHAWHRPAVKKDNGDRNRELHRRTMAVSTHERIRRLTRDMGGGMFPRSGTAFSVGDSTTPAISLAVERLP